MRLNFNYFISEAEFDYLLGAIELVAKHGWRVLPYYEWDRVSGMRRFHNDAKTLPVSLTDLSFDQWEPKEGAQPPTWELGELLARAEQDMTTIRSKKPETAVNLPDEAERLRWFALP